jgi:hypothetical protein
LARDDLGGVDEDELRAFMATHPDFRDAGTDVRARFARAIASLLVRRLPRGEPDGFCVFVQSDSLAADVDSRTVTPMPFLGTGNDEIVGSTWLVQAELKNAYRLDGSAPSHASLLDHLVTVGFGSRPTIIVDARSQPWQPRLYPYGASEPDLWIAIDLSDSPVPEANMKDTVDRFWNQGLRTPELARQSNVPIWINATQGVPHPRPEQRIQWRLRDTLIGAFPRRYIRAETRTEEGRSDIFIIADVAAMAGTPAQSTDWVLELKVLCDMTSTANAIADAKAKADEALEKGVVQAIGYRTVQNGVQAALCCFEMRSTDEDDETCFACIKAKAEQTRVRLWRWHLFRDVNDARMARYG